MMPQLKTVKNLSDLDFEPQDFDVVYCTDPDQFMIYQEEEWRPLSIISGANHHPASLKEAKCKNCGSPLDMVGHHNYRCSYCGSNYIYD